MSILGNGHVARPNLRIKGHSLEGGGDGGRRGRIKTCSDAQAPISSLDLKCNLEPIMPMRGHGKNYVIEVICIR